MKQNTELFLGITSLVIFIISVVVSVTILISGYVLEPIIAGIITILIHIPIVAGKVYSEEDKEREP